MLECVSILVDRDQSTPPSCCSSAWSQILVSQLLTLFQPAWWQLCTGRASERVWSRARVICRPRFPPSYSKTLPLPSCQRFRQRPCKNPALEANPSGPQYFHQKKKKEKANKAAEAATCVPLRPAKSLARQLQEACLGKNGLFSVLGTLLHAHGAAAKPFCSVQALDPLRFHHSQ